MKLFKSFTCFIFVMACSILVLFGCVMKPNYDAGLDNKFVVLPLGTKGGLIESDLSSYLVSPLGETNFIALDAGTILSGLHQAKKKGSLNDIELPKGSPLSHEGVMMRDHIKAYVISHAHADHIAGLVLNSPDDSAKEILGLPSTINNIRDHLFNWKIWPNFGDEGEGYQLKKYQYVRLTPLEKYSVKNTAMVVTPFELSHSGGYLSTAFLIESRGAYMLYFGDTGPDALEKSERMKFVWTAIAPLIRKKKLHGIFLEVSFPNDHKDSLLFGHLSPKWMMKELSALAKIVDPEKPEKALFGLKIIVTHIKPTLNQIGEPKKQIMKELAQLNNLGLEFLLPESGERLLF